MADSTYRRPEITEEERGKRRVDLHGNWLSWGSWNLIDPLYVWSAAIGLLLGLVLIATAVAMQAARLR